MAKVDLSTMTAEQKSKLAKLAASLGDVGKGAAETFAQQVFDTMPEEQRAKRPDTDVEIVMSLCDSYAAARKGLITPTEDGPETAPLTVDAPKAPKAPKAKVEFSVPTLSDSEQETVDKLVAESVEARMRVTSLAVINNIYTKNPKPSTYLTGKTVVLDKKYIPDMEKYKASLAQDEENKKAFNEIYDAINNGTPLPVNINDKILRVEGVKMSAPTTTAGKDTMEEKIYTTDQLNSFITAYAFGRISNDKSEIGVGAKLSSLTATDIKGKRSKTNSSYGKTTITYGGHTTAFKNDNFETINEVSKDNPTVKKTVKIAKTFTIVTNEKDEAGNYKTKKIRLSGSMPDHPRFVRKPEYTSIWSATDRDIISSTLTAKEQTETIDTLKKIIAATATDTLVSRGAEIDPTFIKTIKDAVKAAKAVTPATPSMD